MTVDDICQLMACMAQNKVGMLEFEGLKLGLAPEKPVVASAAGGIRPGPAAEATVPNAMKAVQEARMQAAEQAKAKLAAAQTRTARARQKAAGGIGDGVLKAVESVYRDAVSHPAPPASVVTEPSELDPNVP